jgi:hypothetical protein
MKEVIVIKRRRSWEWQVQDQNRGLIMRGRERTRPAARYQAYRTLFMLLAIGRRPADLPTRESGQSESAMNRVRSGPSAQRTPSAQAGPAPDGLTSN